MKKPNKKEKVISEVKNEIKVWQDLEAYVIKNMRGKTLTKDLEKEIKLMASERTEYLRRLQ